MFKNSLPRRVKAGKLPSKLKLKNQNFENLIFDFYFAWSFGCLDIWNFSYITYIIKTTINPQPKILKIIGLSLVISFSGASPSFLS